MTLAELERSIESKRRVQKVKAQEQASFDYILANLVGYSVARIQSSANHMPEISEAYPSLFATEEIQEQKQERKDELSVIRFKLFANAHNAKFEKEAANN